ncbi:MAG: efflux RND transporter permease subunit, partial [Planctomycetota bacterium]|nr:efflux RND transporter permease subunit [Planctomycetota bacterium]
MDALIAWSLRHRAVVLLSACALLVWGSLAARRMPVDVFPDLTAPTVTVLTEAPGFAAIEMERLVTFPIESTLTGAHGVRRVRSSSTAGISIVHADFDWGTDILRARQTVAEKIALAAESLPEAAGSPTLGPVTSIMGEVLFAGLTGGEGDPLELRDFADRVLRRRLLAVPGVAQVSVIGGEAREFQVRLDPVRMALHGVSTLEISAALDAANRTVSAGFATSGGGEYVISLASRLQDREDVAGVVVRNGPGAPVRVADLSTVIEAARPVRGTGAVMDEPGIVLGIQKQPEVNTLELTRLLDAALDGIESELPPGSTLHRNLLRQADFIEVSLLNLLHALRDGALLVVAIIGLFLLNLRATAITLTALPLSLIAALLVLDAFGHSLNAMTIGGMAIAVGALVDDAVIDVENVFRRLRENARRKESERRPSLEVVRDASIEIRASIVFATLIIMLVFLPSFFLEGVEGRLMLPLGLTYVVALAASLLVAVTVTPVLCALLLPGSSAVRTGREPAPIRALRSGYDRTLAAVLSHSRWLLGGVAVLLILAGVGAARFGTAFLPEFQEGALTLTAVTLPGTSLEQSDELVRAAERVVMRQPGVMTVARRTGRAELDEHAEGVEYSEIDVRLEPGLEDREEMLARLREELSMIPGLLFSVGQPISHRIDHMLSGTRAAIAVKIFGTDLAELRRIAAAARDAMAAVPGAVDLAVETQVEIPSLRIQPDAAALSTAGIAPAEFAASVEAIYQGHLATEILRDKSRYDVVLRHGEAAPKLSELERLPLASGAALVSLGEVAQLQRSSTPNKIGHENGERRIVVSCNVAGRDLGAVAREVQAAVDAVLEAEPDYRVEYGGQFESASRARQRLLLLGALVAAGVSVLLHAAFRSARDAALVMINLPLSLIGGVAGVWWSGGVLSIGALIGFIAVFGIAARNGIMLVAHIRHLQEHEGVSSFRDAVSRGASERVAPILMTALAAGLALVPLALSGGEP